MNHHIYSTNGSINPLKKLLSSLMKFLTIECEVFKILSHYLF